MPSTYLSHFPAFVRAFGGQAFASQTVWRLGEFGAVALWFAPHAEPDGDAVVAEIRRSVAADQHVDCFAVLEQMDSVHPTFPHWYLPWFGVEGAQQGKGLGSELMRNCLGFVRPGPSARLPRVPQPAQHPVLRASRLRGHRGLASWGLPAGVLDAAIAAIVRPCLAARAIPSASGVDRLDPLAVDLS